MEGAIKREVKEETNLDVYDFKLIITQEFINDPVFWKKRHFIFFDFACKTNSTRIKLNKEAQEHVWVTPQEALKMDVEPYSLKAIKTFLDKK